jgi:hypothetical protein
MIDLFSDASLRINDAASQLLLLWQGPPQDQSQVMPRLAEMNRFEAMAALLHIQRLLLKTPGGPALMERLEEALIEASGRYVV